MRTLPIMALAAIAAAPCESTPPPPQSTVDYTIACDPDEPEDSAVVCHDADFVETYEGDDGDYLAVECSWTCAIYEGQPDTYVWLQFTAEDGGCYQLDSQYIDEDTGLCPGWF